MYRLNDYFDKIYVISLPAANKRREHIKKLSKDFGFEFEFVDAVDFKSIDIEVLKKEEKIAYLGNTFFCTKKCTCNGLGHDLDIRQLGPNLSHFKVWNKIIDLNLSNALILEDDCHFKPGFQKSFNEVAKNAFHSFIATFLLVFLGVIAAFTASLIIEKNFFTLLLSYCPGGIYEVAVIAIFFNLDPEFVSFHHIIRLLMILFVVPVILRFLKKT